MRNFHCRAAGIVVVMLMSLGAVTPVAAQMFSFGASSGSSVYDRYVVPFSQNYAPRQIIVSFGDRRLYYIFRRGRAISYPIAVPRAEDRWEGTLKVSMKRENPSLPKHVPGGHPRNPLGVHALYLGNTLYRIHGTDAPWTIGTNVSKGCVRMHNAHIAELFGKVSVGTKVTATWRRYRPSSYVSSNPFNDLAGFLGLN
jgi:lipoprotein-anchoring transpeptidase ErfK/SrfK